MQLVAKSSVIAVALLMSACQIQAEPAEHVGEAPQPGAGIWLLGDRWYGMNHLNRVNYYVGYLPNDANQHYQGTLDAFQAYNASTAIDFEPAPVIHLGDGYEIPDPADPEPHVTYVDVDVADWVSQTLSYATLAADAAAENPPGIYTFILDAYGPTGSNIVRPADPNLGRHEDFLVAFRPDVSFADLHVPLHETGHVLGMIHEQNRPDRCNYVEIFPDCIEDNLVSQFDETDDAVILSPYDVTSIMQYQSTFACKANIFDVCFCDTMLYRGGASPIQEAATDQCTGDSVNFGTEIATTSQLSPEDINTLYQMYPPILGTDEADDDFGFAMAAGDFDGDGYVDLAVGAPGEQPISGIRTGVVYLYKGTYTGLMPWRVVIEPGGGRLDGDRFGYSLAAVDVDGDEKSELIVGAPRRSVGGSRRGAVYVFSGDSTGVVSPREVTAGGAGFDASAAGDWFGETLTVGDFNGDHSPEIVVGAPAAHRVYVIKSATWTKYGPAFGAQRDAVDRFGASLAAGDLDDDGFDDLAIGAPATGSGRPGRVFYVRGKATGFGDVNTLEEPGLKVANDRFGTAVAIGQFDPLTTTKRSLAVGAPGHSASEGRMFLFNPGLPTSGANPHSLAEFGVPNQPGAGFGGRLIAGQLDAVGGADLVVGMPFESEPGLPEAGLVGIYHGRSVAAETTMLIPGVLTGTPNAHGDAAPFDHFGSAMAIGDFDRRPIPIGGNIDISGDVGNTARRVNDLAIATASRNDGAGAVWVHQGFPLGDPTYPADENVFTGYVSQGDASDRGNLLLYRR